MPIGRTAFGRYELLKKISAGGMGEVFLATLSGPGGFQKLLVIKRVLAELARERNFIDMFLAEARLSGKLSHKNIVQIFDLGSIDGSYFLAMEYVPGRSLADLISRAATSETPIPAGHIVDIVSQLCDGLGYAHSATDAHGPLNLVHRDVSPRNILLSYVGDVKIIDFGVAKSRLQLAATQIGVIKGKLAYMSPEQSAGELIDKRSDIFSVGVCLYELCALKHPFYDPNQLRTIDAIRNQEPLPLALSAPDRVVFAPILARAIAKDRRDRYADCAALRRDLQALLINHEVELPEQSLAEYLQKIFAESIEEDNEVLREVTNVDAVTYRSGVWATTAADSTRREPMRGLARALHIREAMVKPLAAILALTVVTAPLWYAVGSRLGSHRETVAVSPQGSGGGATPTTPPADVRAPAREAAPPEPTTRGNAGDGRPFARAKKAASDTGQLKISTTPLVGVYLEGRRIAGRLVTTEASGNLMIGTGRDATTDPFEVRLSYRRKGAGLIYSIDTSPWSIVLTGHGDGLGRTPLELQSTPESTVIELNNPRENRRLRLTLTYKP